MANLDIILPVAHSDTLPVVRKITAADLMDVLKKGLADFWAMPTHVVFLGLIYPIVGVLLGRASFGYDVVPLLFPMAAGFAILGPIAAIGLYELSRRRELELDTSWWHAFDILHSPSRAAIAALGGLLLFIFFLWIATANEIYVSNFGSVEPASWWVFAREVLTTPAGHNLIIAGNAAGAVFAIATFILSVVSFPLLLDRNVGLTTAMLTSVRALMLNPLVMVLWGLIVAVSLAVGFLLFFFGLAIIMPVLGHSTWHLYRKLVEPDLSPRPDYVPSENGVRYGADFPANLFTKYRRS